MKGKIQKNEYGNNMLVQADGSTSYFMGEHFEAEIEPMTDAEIVDEFKKQIGNIGLSQMKDFLKSIDGFCKSNVTGTHKGKKYSYGSLFRYKEI